MDVMRWYKGEPIESTSLNQYGLQIALQVAAQRAPKVERGRRRHLAQVHRARAPHRPLQSSPHQKSPPSTAPASSTSAIRTSRTSSKSLPRSSAKRSKSGSTKDSASTLTTFAQSKKIYKQPAPLATKPLSAPQPAPEQKQLRLTTSYAPPMNEEEHELIISNIQNNSTMFYSINEQGAKIGRQVSNQIHIPEESISRNHAEIYFADEKFYLKDVGSTSGTFIKINGRMPLSLGHIIEMGANQFQVDEIKIESKNKGEIKLTLVENGPDEVEEEHYRFELEQGECRTIGRKMNNHICFSQDQHLSGVHAKIYIFDGQFHIQDQGSTNGTWRRLSPEGEVSQGVPLQNGSIFKIGVTISYICKLKKLKHNVTQAVGPACIICCEAEKDCLYLPCKHNICCLKCSKGVTECPICKSQITQCLRMYKC